MNVACLIIGIDGWEEYTRPLIEGILKHEPSAQILVIDNASEIPYPETWHRHLYIHRTDRLSYSAAINVAKEQIEWVENKLEGFDVSHYLVLSNDVLCEGPFAERLQNAGDDTLVGPTVGYVFGNGSYFAGYPHVMGYCVAIPRKIWESIGKWDERFTMSSWEDVDYSIRAYRCGFKLCYDAELPFRHLDQRQRFEMAGFYPSNDANLAYLRRKHGIA